MKHVLCTLPNASTLINGVAFTVMADGMLSVPVADDIAESFAAIAGYTAIDLKPAEKTKATKQETSI